MLTITLFQISLLIHLFCAIVWLGSLVALEFIVIPSFLSESTSFTGELVRTVSKKYSLVAQISSIIILITGIYQTFAIGYLDITQLAQTFIGNLIILKVALYFIFGGISIRASRMLFNFTSEVTIDHLRVLLTKSRNLFFADVIIGLLIMLIAISL